LQRGREKSGDSEKQLLFHFFAFTRVNNFSFESVVSSFLLGDDCRGLFSRKPMSSDGRQSGERVNITNLSRSAPWWHDEVQKTLQERDGFGKTEVAADSAFAALEGDDDEVCCSIVEARKCLSFGKFTRGFLSFPHLRHFKMPFTASDICKIVSPVPKQLEALLEL
jgi:hypothetical protein